MGNTKKSGGGGDVKDNWGGKWQKVLLMMSLIMRTAGSKVTTDDEFLNDTSLT